MNREETAVTDSIQNTPTETGDPTVRHISGEAPLDNASKLISALPETSNLIVDPLDVLESQEPPSRFRSFIALFNTVGGGMSVGAGRFDRRENRRTSERAKPVSRVASS